MFESRPPRTRGRGPGALLDRRRQVAAGLDTGTQCLPGGPPAGRFLEHAGI